MMEGPDIPVGVDREEFDADCPACKTSLHHTMYEVMRQQEETKH